MSISSFSRRHWISAITASALLLGWGAPKARSTTIIQNITLKTDARVNAANGNVSYGTDDIVNSGDLYSSPSSFATIATDFGQPTSATVSLGESGGNGGLGFELSGTGSYNGNGRYLIGVGTAFMSIDFDVTDQTEVVSLQLDLGLDHNGFYYPDFVTYVTDRPAVHNLFGYNTYTNSGSYAATPIYSIDPGSYTLTLGLNLYDTDQEGDYEQSGSFTASVGFSNLATPEPGSTGLLMCGAGALIARRRRELFVSPAT